MANGRGGFYGDVLANVLENAGRKVTREYYVNDAGNQVKLLGESILAAEGKIPDKEEYYKGEYIKKLKGKSAKQAIAILLKEIKSSLKKAGIKHNVFFSEDKNLHKKGELDKTLRFLSKKGLVEKRQGATWFKNSDSVLVKSDSNPTYFLADLAYHYDKLLKRKFDLAIDIWGADHHGYAQRMKKGVEALGVKPERLKILITQLVRLVSGGKEVKMSKRKGDFVTMDDLLEEVGADATRFFFLMHSLDTHMDFDMDLAKEKSQKNPVYYAQYALVRCTNILLKSKVKSQKSKVNLSLLSSDSEVKLMMELIKFPDVLAQTAEDYQVHRLTRYATELAKTFHNFYEKERVVGVGGNLESVRLALVSATKIVFEKLFDILGISKPKKM
jgi:arginyl-tRNA synthetase